MSCQCSEKRRPLKKDLPEGSNQRPRQWFVTRRNRTASAFNGWREQYSDYSEIFCRVCGAYWRTKASYVPYLDNCEYWPRSHPPKVEPIE